jgi:hypothetical protein
MFPRLWERAVAFFHHLLLAAFHEAERRADAEIAQRFETRSANSGMPLPGPEKQAQQGMALPSQQSVAETQPPTHSTQVAIPPLPPLPTVPVPDHNGSAAQTRRPRGRPRKEPPPC